MFFSKKKLMSLSLFWKTKQMINKYQNNISNTYHILKLSSLKTKQIIVHLGCILYNTKTNIKRKIELSISIIKINWFLKFLKLAWKYIFDL